MRGSIVIMLSVCLCSVHSIGHRLNNIEAAANALEAHEVSAKCVTAGCRKKKEALLALEAAQTNSAMKTLMDVTQETQTSQEALAKAIAEAQNATSAAATASALKAIKDSQMAAAEKSKREAKEFEAAKAQAESAASMKTALEMTQKKVLQGLKNLNDDINQLNDLTQSSASGLATNARTAYPAQQTSNPCYSILSSPPTIAS